MTAVATGVVGTFCHQHKTLVVSVGVHFLVCFVTRRVTAFVVVICKVVIL